MEATMKKPNKQPRDQDLEPSFHSRHGGSPELSDIWFDLSQLPDGWRLADERDPDVYTPNTATFVYRALGDPVPTVWRAADARRMFERYAALEEDRLTGVMRDERERKRLTDQAKGAKGAATKLKERPVSPQMKNVLAMEQQLGPDATNRQIADALLAKGHEGTTQSNVARARKKLRDRGY
jgi:hypothetical protein